jgi:hypothetical protein
MRIYSNSKKLMIFRTRYNIYKYKMLFFNLINGSIIFQRYINNVFSDFLDDFIIIYLDDILIYSENEFKHTAYIRKIIQCFQKTNLQIDIKKCEFNTKRMKYFEFIVNIKNIKINFEKIEIIII